MTKLCCLDCAHCVAEPELLGDRRIYNCTLWERKNVYKNGYCMKFQRRKTIYD